MHLFFTPDIDVNSLEYVLQEEESKHGVRVLRLSEGREIALVDGRGNFFKGEIIEAHPKRTRVRILSLEKEFGKRNHYLHIAVAPTKNLDRLEWFLEKATEIGIDEVTPIICEHSERREVKVDRLYKVVTSAIKQSQRAYLPKINEATPLPTFLSTLSQGQHFIAHCEDQEKFGLDQLVELQGHYNVLIGPEGDFSPSEISLALAQGCQPVTLGNTRLRTETAALYACFEINFLNRT